MHMNICDAKQVYYLIRPSLALLGFFSYLLGLEWNVMLTILKFKDFYGFPWPEVTVILVMLFISLFANVINSYVDSKDTDKVNPYRKDVHNIFLYKNWGARHALLLATISLLTSIIIAIYSRIETLYAVILVAIISVLYSYFPRLKGKAPLDLLSNTLSLWVIPFCLGWTYHSPIQEVPIDIILGGFLTAASYYLLTAMIDIKSDSKANIKTTAVVLGFKRTVVISLLMNVIAVLIMINFMMNYPLALIPYIGVIFFLLILLSKPTEYEALKTIMRIAVFFTIYVFIMIFTPKS